MAIFRNLTPHAVDLVQGDTRTTPVAVTGTRDVPAVYRYPVDGPAPRVTTNESYDLPIHDDVNNIYVDTVVSVLSDTITDLPDPQPGVILIVSRMTCEAKPQRTDLVYPEGIVRSPDGVPIGCRKFGRVRPTG
jgi:hypothetical protein